MRHRRARGDRPLLSRSRHVRPGRARRRDVDRTGACRRGGGARRRGRHQFRRGGGGLGRLARWRSSPRTALPELTPGSSHGVSVSVHGRQRHGMERDYDYTSAVHAADLGTPPIGRRAGERAVKRLNPRKVATCRCRSCMSGASPAPSCAICRRHLRLLGRARHQLPEGPHGNAVFASQHHHHRRSPKQRGLRSSPSTARAAKQRRNIIDQGVLTSWFLDLRSARQLGLRSTGHASRSTSGPPSPSADQFLHAARRAFARTRSSPTSTRASMSPR